MRESEDLRCDGCGGFVDFSDPVTHVVLQTVFPNYDSAKPAYPCCECGRLHLVYGNGVGNNWVGTLKITQERKAYLIANKVVLKD